MATPDPDVPHLPPLFSAVSVQNDPFGAAQVMARGGCDAGSVTWCLSAGTLRAAIVFAPDVALRDAAIMLPLCGIGLQNALGALAPPEVAVHLDWPGDLRVNGGQCGALTVAASSSDPTEIPDWLVIGLIVPFLPATDDTGDDPDHTALYAEGCGDMDPVHLLEAWVRHTLVWLNRWNDDGPAPLHREWLSLADRLKKEVTFVDQTARSLDLMTISAPC